MPPVTITPEWRAELLTRLAGRRIVASVSGGKDSAAMSLWLRELELPHDRVFLDTKFESPKTYEYLRGELTRVLGPIIEVGSAVGGMEDWVKKKGMFPSKKRRFCTQELKVFPMQKHLEQYEAEEVINTVGVRAGESLARSKLTEWEWSDGFDCEVWRPIFQWTEQDVIDIHHRHGLRPNPLYLEGFSRVGCFPCIYARKGEIRLIAERYPERIDLLRMLEQKAKDSATARYAKKGETFESLGYMEPSFFQSPLKARPIGIPVPCKVCAETEGKCVVCAGTGLLATVLERQLVALDQRLAATPPSEQTALVEELRALRAQYENVPAEGHGACEDCEGTGNCAVCKGTHQVQSMTNGGGCWPIDKVVQWAKTEHGGRQMMLLDAAMESNRDEGCLKWGLCSHDEGKNE